MNKLPKVFIAVFFLISGSFIFVNVVNAQETSDLLLDFKPAGAIEDEGRQFEITDSRYLNITLDSSEAIKLKMESIPEMITAMIEPLVSSSTSTQIIFSGFASSTKYFKYQDDYHNLTEFTTDENGTYTYLQDLSKPHFVFIQPRASTKFIKDDQTGGDCYLIGTWDAVTKTCTLTTDLNETIQIDSNDVTLDGKGHIITGSGTGSGVFLSGRNKATIKNLDISKFTYGVFLFVSNNNSITNNFSHNNYNDGIRIDGGGYSNHIKDNTISYNYFGISIWGSLNNIVNNIITSNGSRGIWIGGEILPAFNLVSSNIISNSIFGIQMTGANTDTISNNTILNYTTGIYGECCVINNKIFNNNILNGWVGVYIGFGSSGNIFNLSAPIGGNYWVNFDEPSEGCNDFNNDNFCDSPRIFTGGQDNLPWIKQDGWKIPANQPPIISNFGQFKSDATTAIFEGGIITESTIVFNAALSDSNNDQIKLQIELKEFDQTFNSQDLLESDFYPSGSEITLTRDLLTEGQYHWRARAIDNKGNPSQWQEFGTAGNIDFEVKLVPLYTQVRSPYPSESATEEWSQALYAEGRGNLGPLEERCGLSIAECGCAITSMIMLGRYYKIETGIDNTNSDPGNINVWLTSNVGYAEDGRLYWGKAIEYLGFIENGVKKVRLILDYHNATSSLPIVDSYITSAKPAVAYSNRFGHYFVVDDKLQNTYTLKDPRWYNTKKLNDPENLANEVRGYNNYFDTANLFSYLETPKKLTASIYFYLSSPAELFVADPLGRKLGKDPILNLNYNEIPDASYTKEGPIITSDTPIDPSKFHEIKAIYIPEPIDGRYDIKVIGIEAGSYTLGVLVYDQSGNSKDVSQKGNIIPNTIQELDLNYSLQTSEKTELYRTVDIDIKPGSYPNSINCQNLKGVIPVAILTTNIFDATAVDPDTVRFGPSDAQEIHKDRNGKAQRHIEDVDKDGDLDSVFHFKFGDTGIQCGDQTATLSGKTKEGFDITGSDSIRIIQGSNKQNIFTRFLNKLLGNIYEALFR